MAHESAPSLVWLRDDLRIADNPAIHAAVDREGPVILVFVLDENPSVARPLGAASRWWLHHSLSALGSALVDRGARLILRRGDAEQQIADIISATGARSVFWNRRYGRGEREQDRRVKERWRAEGLDVASFAGNLLHEPWTIMKADGTPYEVYSAFWRAAQRSSTGRDVVPSPHSIYGWSGDLQSDQLDDWQLLPTSPDWAKGLRDEWTPGEEGAHARARTFAASLRAYGDHRDDPGYDATSRLSPHLKFGEISPHQLWADVVARHQGAAVDRFASELGWREFNYSLLYHHPDIAIRNLREEYDAMPWSDPSESLNQWQKGITGFPLVDAGMRQLWTTGWMHNRVRMVVASFLIKNLHIDWRLGEQWFWDTLVDADPANNTANWQWVAGSGVDAAPFFRVFNPVTQSRKFDADGTFIKTWVPELNALDASSIHEPWNVLGAEDYPAPLVDLRRSREEALDGYAKVRGR